MKQEEHERIRNREMILKPKYNTHVANTMKLLTKKIYSIAATFKTCTQDYKQRYELEPTP